MVAKESKGKVLIVGKNKEFEANDHNSSFILDIILVQFMLKEDREESGKNTECNEDIFEQW